MNRLFVKYGGSTAITNEHSSWLPNRINGSKYGQSICRAVLIDFCRGFNELSLCSHIGDTEIPVPSRLRSSKSEILPLAGLRIAVKDNIHLQGVKTSLCNSAYAMTYAPSTYTAPCIQTLLDNGAVVLGKTKLAPFGHFAEPVEYIDYEAPWNPRADGYQSPGGSCSGSACAIAAYDWLDVTIGTDSKLYPSFPTKHATNSRSRWQYSTRCIADWSFRYATNPWCR